jgi:hypothetical protein
MNDLITSTKELIAEKPADRPVPGQFCLCIKCGLLEIVTFFGQLRPVTPEEFAALSPAYQRYLSGVTKAILDVQRKRRGRG